MELEQPASIGSWHPEQYPMVSSSIYKLYFAVTSLVCYLVDQAIHVYIFKQIYFYGVYQKQHNVILEIQVGIDKILLGLYQDFYLNGGEFYQLVYSYAAPAQQNVNYYMRHSTVRKILIFDFLHIWTFFSIYPSNNSSQ